MKLFGIFGHKKRPNTVTSTPELVPVTARDVDREADDFMHFLRLPENALGLNQLRTAVDNTSYWKKLISGTSEEEKNAGRDEAIHEAIRHLFAHTDPKFQKDMEHHVFYITTTLDGTDNFVDYKAYTDRVPNWIERTKVRVSDSAVAPSSPSTRK